MLAVLRLRSRLFSSLDISHHRRRDQRADERTETVRRDPSERHQARVFENAQMLRDRRLGHVEALGDLARAQCGLG